MPEDPVSGQASNQDTQPAITSQTPTDASIPPSQVASQPQPPSPVQPPSGTGQGRPPFKTNLLIIALILIVLAATVGLVIYFSFIKKPAQIALPGETVLPAATLVIDEPQDQQATTSAEIMVRGRADPNSQVIIYTETYEEIFEADTAGNFSGVFSLDEGPNEITFTSSSEGTEETSQTRSVVYLTNEEL